jgi:hypothetical protein
MSLVNTFIRTYKSAKLFYGSAELLTLLLQTMNSALLLVELAIRDFIVEPFLHLLQAELHFIAWNYIVGS